MPSPYQNWEGPNFGFISFKPNPTRKVQFRAGQNKRIILGCSGCLTYPFLLGTLGWVNFTTPLLPLFFRLALRSPTTVQNLNAFGCALDLRTNFQICMGKCMGNDQHLKNQSNLIKSRI